MGRRGIECDVRTWSWWRRNRTSTGSGVVVRVDLGHKEDAGGELSGGCAALVVAAAAWISAYGSVADNVAENIVEGAVGDCTPGAAAEEAINNYFNGECAILNPQGVEFGRVGSTDLTSATGTMSG